MVNAPIISEEILAWVILSFAIVLEIVWAISLKWTHGYTRLPPSICNALLAIADIIVLSKAVQLLPTSVAYAVWTGLGAAGVTVFAILFQGETWRLSTLFFISLIVIGVAGLKLAVPD